MVSNRHWLAACEFHEVSHFPNHRINLQWMAAFGKRACAKMAATRRAASTQAPRRLRRPPASGSSEDPPIRPAQHCQDPPAEAGPYRYHAECLRVRQALQRWVRCHGGTADPPCSQPGCPICHGAGRSGVALDLRWLHRLNRATKQESQTASHARVAQQACGQASVRGHCRPLLRLAVQTETTSISLVMCFSPATWRSDSWASCLW
jgi:hypothetical protein